VWPNRNNGARAILLSFEKEKKKEKEKALLRVFRVLDQARVVVVVVVAVAAVAVVAAAAVYSLTGPLTHSLPTTTHAH
jgi:hypothetical protein